jgi:hypothetical protein
MAQAVDGRDEHPDRLNAIIYEDRYLLAMARADEDERILRYISSLDEASIVGLQKIRDDIRQALRAETM